MHYIFRTDWRHTSSAPYTEIGACVVPVRITLSLVTPCIIPPSLFTLKIYDKTIHSIGTGFLCDFAQTFVLPVIYMWIRKTFTVDLLRLGGENKTTITTAVNQHCSIYVKKYAEFLYRDIFHHYMKYLRYKAICKYMIKLISNLISLAQRLVMMFNTHQR